MEDEDSNISMILSMGFGDIAEIKTALRISKGDVNEAVSYLMDQPNPGGGYNMDIDDINFKTEDEIFASSDSNEFPAHAVFELENRVFQENWNIPYKREELLGVCLEASTRLAREGNLEQNEAARKFLERILPEALKKLLTSNAIYRWASEIQEGIYTMCEMFLDLIVARLTYEPVPFQLMQTLGLVFDYSIEWHSKNKEVSPDESGPPVRQIWAEPNSSFQTRERYGWLCDLINHFGDKNGFKLIRDNIEKSREPLTAKTMSSMLMPLANCAPMLIKKSVDSYLTPCLKQAFKFSRDIDEEILKSKDMNYLHDLCHSLKMLCHHHYPAHETECDNVRLQIINRMLRTPHYNCRMNGLKEVCRLIEEADRKKHKYDISSQTVMEWMTENKILSVVLEGNIDQVQYTDKIKSIVEFLGPNLSADEIRSIWSLGEEDSSHVMDNVHSILASASSRFNLTQLELINKLVKEKWAKSSTRIKEKLIALVGQIGKETVQAKHLKAVNSVLSLLWEVAHSSSITRHLVELALKEHLNTLSELSVNVDPILRQYILLCVDDIKKSNKVMLPFVKHLHEICKSYGSKSSAGYQKASKATLLELNKQHEIVKLISTSLNKAHKQAVQSATQMGLVLKPDTLVDSMYTHQESVQIHLELMQFLLKDGDLYLSWARCKELWETLITNENRIQMDQDCLFTWFTTCCSDLEAETQKQFYKEKLLSLPTATVSQNSFTCLQKYFEIVNSSEGRLKKSIHGYTVEKTELAGMEYLWDIVTNCAQDDIAERAMQLILNTSYLTVSTRLKKEPRKLHKMFMSTCFNRLETTWAEREDCQLAPNQGFELETSSEDLDDKMTPPLQASPLKDSFASPLQPGEAGAPSPTSIPMAVANATRRLPGISVSKIVVPPLDKGTKALKIRRLLQLAEKYVSSVEVLFKGKRTIPPHAATFYGRPLKINVVRRSEPKKDDFELECHTNETVGGVKQRIADKMGVSLSSLTTVSIDAGEEEIILDNDKGKDSRLLGWIGDSEGQTWKVKSTASSSTSTAVVPATGSNSEPLGSPRGNLAMSPVAGREGLLNQSMDIISPGRQAYELDEEKNLPGVIMASEQNTFSLLYKLAQIEDSNVLAAIRRVLHLIPTDQDVANALDSIPMQKQQQQSHQASSAASPRGSPIIRKSANGGSTRMEVAPSPTPEKNSGDRKASVLEKILDYSAQNMNPLRVLYNLEVLSSRIMPCHPSTTMVSVRFGEDILKEGGLRHLLNVLDKEALPFDVDTDTRQSAYLISLQLAGYLLCGQQVLHHGGRDWSGGASGGSGSAGGSGKNTPPPSSPLPQPVPAASPMARPTPPKKSALDLTASDMKSPLALSASKVVQTMGENEYVELLTCLVRVVWAAAAGKLFLASMGIQSAPKADRVYIGRRSRDSSTGSSGSLGSEGSNVELSLHAGICAQQTQVSPADSQIAGEALELLVTCLTLRQCLLPRFYSLPSVNDFIIDTVLGSPAQVVRKKAVEQFIRLSKMKVVRRNLSLPDCSSLAGGSNSGGQGAADRPPQDPRQFLTQLLLKTPVPLWIPSCKSRTTGHQIMSNCGEYLDLRCQLLKGLTLEDQKRLNTNAAQMINDEITWILNFSPCIRAADSSLMAGHIKLVKSLLSCEGVSKDEIGASIIEPLVCQHLFPASKLIKDGGLLLNPNTGKDITPLLDTDESRHAAYSLLIDLTDGSPQNTELLSNLLVDLHHGYDPNMVTEHKFDYEPAIERRADCNYVGLKNGGATCYINSVMQQLYAVPGVSEQLLAVNLDTVDEDSAFFQLQAVFAHLQESKLKFYIPERFWKCFKFWGEQPVNVREQQDACEFFIQIVDQVDEFLDSVHREKIFSKIFQGSFSDQKVCQGCPHRYEREENFTSLDLQIKSGNLQDSLLHYVQDETLEGDNSYYCEKCRLKRNTIKRTCIKKLPPTLVIQLKRFHYDWETNRAMKFDDYFSFPRVLDMAPYTAEGRAEVESRESMQSKLSPGLTLQTSPSRFTANYDLVGVVVHSGQANAGHYYSFIKERKGHSVVNVNKNKWFKFNDTTVEEINMTDETLETECFGGKFKAKKKEGSNLPEERQRYWNGYILVYEARNDGKTPRTPKKSFCGTSRRSVGQNMVRRLTLPPRISEPGRDNLVRESLSELSDLLDKGEKQGLFSNKMPPLIERGIREDNMKFMQNRDLYCEDYYKFVYSLAKLNIVTLERRRHRSRRLSANTTALSPQVQSMYISSMKLAVNFFLNTYCHVRNRDKYVMQDWEELMLNMTSQSEAACQWLVTFLEADQYKYLKPYLLEASCRDIRSQMSSLLEKLFISCYEKAHESKKSGGPSEGVKKLLKYLISLVHTDVPNNPKNCAQYFKLLSMFAQTGLEAVKELFNLELFSSCVKFLLGVSVDSSSQDIEKNRKQWTSSQVREFQHLHSLLSFMILCCDRSPHIEESSLGNGKLDSQNNSIAAAASSPVKSSGGRLEEYYGKLEMPHEVSSLVYGNLSCYYIAEAVTIYREHNNSIVLDMLKGVSFSCKAVSMIIVEETLKQYSTISSTELRNLSSLLVELLRIGDSVQQNRLELVIYGKTGLLELVQSCQKTDTSRAYQAIKCLVTACSKNQAVKEHLLLQPSRWEWAVNWLKSKMEGSYWTDSNSSNEDSTNRTFHRTTSAQVTLDEANAMLAEFEHDIDMEETDKKNMSIDS